LAQSGRIRDFPKKFLDKRRPFAAQYEKGID